MTSLTSWLCWTSSFSDSARLRRIYPSSFSSFWSSFCSSLSRIAFSCLMLFWTLCLSCCIWFFRNEKERGTQAIRQKPGVRKKVFDLEVLIGRGGESKGTILGQAEIFSYFLSIIFQNNGLKSALLKPTLSQNGTAVQDSQASLCYSWLRHTLPPPNFEHWGWTVGHVPPSSPGRVKGSKSEQGWNTEFTNHPHQSMRIIPSK